jgi:hypothetical protein
MSTDFYSILDAQRELGCVSRQTIYNLIAAGRLRRVNLGRRAFITATSIEALKAEIYAGDNGKDHSPDVPGTSPGSGAEWS